MWILTGTFFWNIKCLNIIIEFENYFQVWLPVYLWKSLLGHSIICNGWLIVNNYVYVRLFTSFCYNLWTIFQYTHMTSRMWIVICIREFMCMSIGCFCFCINFFDQFIKNLLFNKFTHKNEWNYIRLKHLQYSKDEKKCFWF